MEKQIGDLTAKTDKYNGIEIYEGDERLCFFNEKGKVALAMFILANANNIQDIEIPESMKKDLATITTGVEIYHRSLIDFPKLFENGEKPVPELINDCQQLLIKLYALIVNNGDK